MRSALPRLVGLLFGYGLLEISTLLAPWGRALGTKWWQDSSSSPSCAAWG